MLWSRGAIYPASPIWAGGDSERDRAIQTNVYAAQCERFLDHWYGGRARRERLKANLIRRAGSQPDPSKPDEEDDTGSRLVETEDGKTVREEATELASISYVRKICTELGVLYASDDLERVYRKPGGDVDESTTETLAWYQAPERGSLTPHLHLLDGWLPGLRTVGLLASWSPDVAEIEYSVLPPHWFEFWADPRHPLSTRLAYAVAYLEPAQSDQDGRPIPGTVYTAYVRPALPSDPPSAPTRGPWADTGMLVRYNRRGAGVGPWPLPDPSSASGRGEILPDPDEPDGLAVYPNPFVLETDGWDPPRRLVWHPLVVHHSEPPVESLRLPVADHLSRMGEETDAGVTDALSTASMQSWGQPVMVGPGDLPTTLGRSHVVQVKDPAGSFTFASPGGLPETHLAVIRTAAQMAASCEHLPYDLLADKPASIETGPAVRLRRHALIQERARRTVDAVRPESARFEIERVLHNAYGVTRERPAIPWDTTLEMHWGELSVPVIWSERLDEMARERALGLSSVVDQIMERHGVSREEAERRAELVREDAARFGEAEAMPAADVPADAVATPADGADAEAVEAPPAIAAEAVPPDTALNGAQVTALLEVVGQAARREIPRNTAIEVIVTAFPVDRATAERIVPQESFRPTEEAPPPRGPGEAERAMPPIVDSGSVR